MKIYGPTSEKTSSSGGAAGAASLSAVYPLGFVRTILAADTSKKLNVKTDFFSRAMPLIDLGDTKGLASSVVGIFSDRAPYSGLFEVVKKFMGK